MSTPAVLITGALTGIGRATALAFADKGAHIVISGRREEQGAALAAKLRKRGAERGICVTTVPVDLGAKEQFSDAYSAVNPRRVVPTLVLEERLANSPYVAGAAFSAADITALVTIDFATKALDLGIPSGHAATRRWYETISARPSTAA